MLNVYVWRVMPPGALTVAEKKNGQTTWSMRSQLLTTVDPHGSGSPG
jgi:hypothetical protein